MNRFFRNLGLGLAALSWLVAASKPHNTSELSWLEGTWQSVQDPADQWMWSAASPDNWTGLHSNPKGEIQMFSVSGSGQQMVCRDLSHYHQMMRLQSRPRELKFQCPHGQVEFEYYQGRTALPELLVRTLGTTTTYRKT